MQKLKPTDFYETPPEVFNYFNKEFNFNFDVCAEIGTAKCPDFYSLERGEDGLKLPWKHRNWCNPPYSNVVPWLRKGIEEMNQNNRFSVFLLKADPSTKWFHDLVYPFASEIRFLKGRIRFVLKGEPAPWLPPWGSMLVVFDPNNRWNQEITVGDFK
jgi:phage N-6-adenine-methyltransferase